MTTEAQRGVAPVSTRILGEAREFAKSVMRSAKPSIRFNLGKEDPLQAAGLRVMNAARDQSCLPWHLANHNGSRLLLYTARG